MNKNLLVFGAGNLGEKVASLWQEKFPEAQIYAITQTNSKHEHLKLKNFVPLLFSETIPTCSFVLVSVPPKESDIYEKLIRKALASWDTLGSLLFISSASIYAENDGGLVVENSAILENHFLYSFEEKILNEKGMVLRLAGLYDENRGPHIYLQNKLSFNSSENSLINLIHTDDAASLAVCALLKGENKAVYLGCDGNSMTKGEFSQIVLGHRASEVQYLESEEKSRNGRSGKVCSGEWSQKVLCWKPYWSDFRSWFSQARRA